MTLFGLSHLAVLFSTILTAVVLCLLVRHRPNPVREKRIAWLLGIVLVLSKLVRLWYAYDIEKSLTWQNGLPMHLCDWACVTSIIALATRNQTAYELTYFWGLAGTLQAVLTPDLDFDFPDPRFITFFVSHCGIIVVLVYMTLGLRFRPTWWSILRVVAWGQVYIAAAAAIDWAIGANYGYLRAKPLNPSLLDHLGPWPWYILSLEVLAVLFYVVYYLPFVIGDVIQKEKSQAA